jgi:branched-chain amino acid transport system permease protein
MRQLIAVARPGLTPSRLTFTAVILVFAFGVVPFIGNSYLFEAVLTPFLILSLAGLGLNVLTGYAGQLSLGSSAFMAVGAYGAYNFSLRVSALPLLVDIALAGVLTAIAGLAFGLPSLRLRGFYLAVSTLAAQFFVQWVLTRFSWLSNDSPSGIIDSPPLLIAGISFDSPVGRYLFTLVIVTALTGLVARLVASETGHNFIAVHDNQLAARVIGVPVLRTKLLAFLVSSFIVGVAGALWAFAFLRTVEPAGFNLDRSFQILFIIIIGGLASIRGAFFGAALIVVTPIILSRAGAAILGGSVDSGVLDMSQRILLGALILVFIIVEPKGLVALWDRLVGLAASRGASRQRAHELQGDRT